MSSQDDDNTGLALGIIFSVVALVVSSVIGMAIYQKSKAVKTAPAIAAVEAPAAMPAAPAADAAATAALIASGAAAVVVENGVVKFYFASGKSELAEGGPKALTDIIAGVQGGKKAIVSGYVDNTGNAEQNKEIAKKRAFVVRDLLKVSGVADDKIELKKPEDIQAGVGPQARRVEVTLQ
jgi:outer membrane protein OmpA-like peptidoglycan-associated protein